MSRFISVDQIINSITSAIKEYIDKYNDNNKNNDDIIHLQEALNPLKNLLKIEELDQLKNVYDKNEKIYKLLYTRNSHKFDKEIKKNSM